MNSIVLRLPFLRPFDKLRANGGSTERSYFDRLSTGFTTEFIKKPRLRKTSSLHSVELRQAEHSILSCYFSYRKKNGITESGLSEIESML